MSGLPESQVASTVMYFIGNSTVPDYLTVGDRRSRLFSLNTKHKILGKK